MMMLPLFARTIGESRCWRLVIVIVIMLKRMMRIRMIPTKKGE